MALLLPLKRQACLLLLCLLAAWPALAQFTITITGVPANTPAADPVYVAGSFNTWDPGATAYRLTSLGGGQYTITLPATVTGAITFKFTRGDWNKVEATASGADIGNRAYTVPATGAATASFTVAGWKDLAAPTSTASPSVSVMSASFQMPQLSRTRKIWLYLPPDYATSTKTYPVLYMHDGQNLFDNTTSFSGEWGVDEALDLMHRQGDWGCIVIGIENGANRLDEYSPYVNPLYGGGQGDQYVDFIVQTLKPYVDSHYRTRPDRLSTGIMGSSMGGLISLYAALKRPDVFGRAGVFSPSLWFNKSIYTFARQVAPVRPDPRIYLLSGGQESQTQVAEQGRMADTLSAAGYMAGTEVNALIKADGQHSEWFWKREFPAAYRYLFPAATAVNDRMEATFQLLPNPLDSNHDILTLQFTDPSKAPKAAHAEVIDARGRVVKKARLLQGKAGFNVRSLPAGAYRVRVGKEVRAWVKQ